MFLLEYNCLYQPNPSKLKWNSNSRNYNSMENQMNMKLHVTSLVYNVVGTFLVLWESSVLAYAAAAQALFSNFKQAKWASYKVSEDSNLSLSLDFILLTLGQKRWSKSIWKQTYWTCSPRQWLLRTMWLWESRLLFSSEQ